MGPVKTKIRDVKGNHTIIALQNVLLVPNLRKRLISISQLTARGAEIIFKKDTCFLSRKGKRFNFGSRVGRLYVLNLRSLVGTKSKLRCQNQWEPNIDFKWEQCHFGRVKPEIWRGDELYDMNSSGSVRSSLSCLPHLTSY